MNFITRLNWLEIGYCGPPQAGAWLNFGLGWNGTGAQSPGLPHESPKSPWPYIHSTRSLQEALWPYINSTRSLLEATAEEHLAVFAFLAVAYQQQQVALGRCWPLCADYNGLLWPPLAKSDHCVFDGAAIVQVPTESFSQKMLSAFWKRLDKPANNPIGKMFQSVWWGLSKSVTSL